MRALRAFEAAARLLSFRLAAEEIGVTQSAVSHQIATLEGWLGVKLFERQTRQVCLTGAGELFRPFCSEAFARIARGAELVVGIGRSRGLVIETYATFLMRWLLPRLPSFQDKAPGLAIRFGASQSDWELNLDGADIGVLWSMHPERPGFDAVLLTRADLVAVCSPEVARTVGDLATLATPTAPPRLGLHTAPGDWDIWLAATGVDGGTGQPTLVFDTYLGVIEAASRGHGIALVPRFLVADDVALGRLRIVVPVAVRQPGGWHIVYRSDQAEDPRISAFVAWIVAAMEGFTRDLPPLAASSPRGSGPSHPAP